MEEQGLQKLAIPILLKQARDIDHTNFALAHNWLGRMHAAPAGLWGAQYWNQNYADKEGTIILRVLLSFRDGSLFASYRARFAGNMSQKYELKKRYVVFEFTSKKTGIVKDRQFLAKDGMNTVDDIEVFEYFLPGEYSFDTYARREYQGGAHDRGSRKRKAFDLSLF